MKGNRIYIASLLVFLLLMFVIEYNLPKSFIWVPTYSQKDHQPFGCAVFDDVLAASFPGEYSVTDKTFYQLSEDSASVRSILSVSSRLQLSDVEVDALLSLAERGSRVVLVASGFNWKLCDTLAFSCSYDYFNARTLRKYAADASPRDTLVWLVDAEYSATDFRFYPHLCQSVFTRYDSLNVALAVKGCEPVAIRQKRGEGEIVLVSTPLLFTNYGVLDEGNAAYLYRVMNHLQGAPLVRTEAYIPSAGMLAKDQTPLRYILSQQPLRWAFYGLLLLLLLFMIFTARRRQRVIPVIRALENKTIEFIELIGTLYHQKKDHTDLLCKKHLYFSEFLRRSVQVDLEEEEVGDERLARRISGKTGVEEARIYALLREIRPIVKGERKADEEKMQRLINEINEIIKHI